MYQMNDTSIEGYGIQYGIQYGYGIPDMVFNMLDCTGSSVQLQ